MTVKMNSNARTSLAVLVIALGWGLIAPARAQQGPAEPDAFQTLRKKVLSAGAEASAKDVSRLLELGRTGGRSYAANVAAKAYFSRQVDPPLEVLLAGADTAYLAGDFRSAVARYKAFLQRHDQADQTAAVAADRLVHVLIDFLQAEENAFAVLDAHGPRLGKFDRIRRYDNWFFTVARRRERTAAMARYLEAIYSQPMPQARRDYFYRDQLEWLLSQVRTPGRDKYPALPALQSLVKLTRGDKRLSPRIGAAAAYLEFHARRAGKSEQAIEKDFQAVTRAATKFLQADPSARTLREIVDTWDNLDGKHDDQTWRIAERAKRQWIRGAFSRLRDDAERTAWLEWASQWDWPHRVMTGKDWSLAAIEHPEAFRQLDSIRQIPFQLQALDRKQLAALAEALSATRNNAGHVAAAAIHSDAFADCLEHLARNGLYHQGRGEYAFRRPVETLWDVYRSLHEGNPQRTSGDVFHRAIHKVGTEIFARSGVLEFDHKMAERYLESSIRTGQKKDLLTALQAVAWCSWDRRDREDVVRDVKRDWQGWVNSRRREARKDDNAKLDPKLVQLIEQVELEFQTLADKDHRGDPDKAPNDLCRQIAEVHKALRHRELEEFQTAARRLYKTVKDFDRKRTPAGWATLDLVISEHRIDTRKLQAEILVDFFADYQPGKSNMWHRAVAYEICQRPRGLEFFRAGRDHQERMLVYGEAFARINRGLIDKGKFDLRLFNYFRGCRRGDHWSRNDVATDVLAEVIDKRLFEAHNVRLSEELQTAATSYMYLLRHEFTPLAAKYPPGSHFDELFISECRKRKFVDGSYWRFGLDKQLRVSDAAAEILTGYQRVEFRFEPGRDGYARQEFNEIQGRILRTGTKAAVELEKKLLAEYGKTHFETTALGLAYFDRVEKGIADRQEQWWQRLDQLTERLARRPARTSPPDFRGLDDLDPSSLDARKTDILLRALTTARPGWWPREHTREMAMLLLEALVAQQRLDDMALAVPEMWKIAGDIGDEGFKNDLARRIARLAEDGHVELAVAMSQAGLEMTSSRLTQEARHTLMAVRAKGGAGMIIPVARSDRRYGIYSAQAAYLSGQLKTAWELYLRNQAVLLDAQFDVYKDLDPEFTIWLIEKNTEQRRYAQAEQVARTMMVWFDSIPRGLDAQIRGELLLAYANVSFSRQEYPKARAQYKRIADAEAFTGTPARIQAKVRIAQVDRATGQFAQALEELRKLTRRNDRQIQAIAYFQMSLVKFEQEQYAEARDFLDKVFTRVPGHPQARVLEGRINLKVGKLEEPTELQVGTIALRKFIVPGAPLKVNLEDQNLARVGKATDIEIRAWTDSGDEEFFSLVPFGDSKTKFRGSLSTELAPARKGDHTLQLLGRDRVHYDYSEAFKERQNIEDSEVYSLTVRTDGQLLISSGQILSKAERQQRALAQRIRRRRGLRDQADPVALSTIRREDQIKPGNNIYVRVVDPDRSITGRIDTLAVQVRTSSGDVIDAFEIPETDTHSGVFEGAVPTTSGQALAYASDSAEGREPNFVISSRQYPAWVGLPVPDDRRAKTFSIDLNDNVHPARMQITADVAGRRITRFILQSSLNGRTFRSLATYPASQQAWQGGLQQEVVRYVESRAPRDLDQARQYMDQGFFLQGKAKAVQPAKSIQGKWNWQLGLEDQARKSIGLDKYGHDEYWLVRYRVAFFQQDARERTFKIRGKDSEKLAYFLAVDGKTGREDPRELTTVLHRGVHVLEVYVWTEKDAGAEFALLGDIPDPPYMAPLEEAFYAGGPREQIAAFVRRQTTPATIAPAADGTEFQVEFAPETSTRVLRLVLADYLSDAPAISKIKLVDREGKTVLPTKEDFRQLRKNKVLEIVPGDRVRVSYTDPTFLTAQRELHEAFLTATYYNAQVAATFLEVQDAGGYMQERYVPMRRFKPGDTIAFRIFDPDGDVSEKPDTVGFTVQTAMGKPRQMTALETAEHSGVFIGRLFPVQSEPAKPAQIRVRPGDQIQLGYLDRENTDPGIPFERSVTIEQTRYVQPEVRVYAVDSQPLRDEQIQAGREKLAVAAEETSEELVLPRRTMTVVWPAEARIQQTQILLGGPLLVEVLHPAVAQSVESTVELFAQTSRGRAMHVENGNELDGAFDLNVPGTIRLRARPGGARTPTPAPGYDDVLLRTNAYAADPLTDGRFTFSVPVAFGPTPAASIATQQPRTAEADKAEPIPLYVHADDEVFLGFRYVDAEAEGKPVRWITRKVTLGGDAFLDVLDRKFQLPVDGLYVGQKMYLRVIDPMANRTDGKDRITIDVTTESGTRRSYQLLETFSHSGVFKGLARVVYKSPEAGQAPEPDALPAVYGDRITLRYTPAGEGSARSWQVEVFKGADGTVVPFTKRFRDKGIASQTQFHLAEAYFELAKRHRALAQESQENGRDAEAGELRGLAKQEILQGKKLLEEAIRDFPDTPSRAQAEYLLGNLALEFAAEAANPDASRKFHLEAVARFTDIVASYPESPYAPKSQYKKALVYEKMGRMNEAFAEYVKLSYRYPENDLVAETIARLGQYFLTRGKEFRNAAEAAEDEVQAVQLQQRARKMYKTAAEVFGRMSKRFPRHDLSGKTQVLSAQCYMQAAEYVEAAKVFQAVIERKKELPNDLVAEAMYWAGDNYMRMAEAGVQPRDAAPALVEAYRVFKKLTWEYPSGKWAKFARGRLTENALQKVASQVDG